MNVRILFFFIFECVISLPGYVCTENFDSLYETEELRTLLENITVKSDDVKLYLITRTNPNVTEVDITNTNKINTLGFDANKDTVFVVHGWLNNYKSPFSANVSSSIIAVRDTNVFITDWFSITQHRYSIAAAAVPNVGKILSTKIEYLVNNSNLNLDKVSIVGHSLGAQVAGVAGNSLNGKLDHIVGLDPAGPVFKDDDNKDNRLDADDAQFVQVIHTNGDSFGYLAPCGDSDYYPNGGKSQPGCESAVTRTCAHMRSAELYVESLTSSDFVAQKCNSYSDYKEGKCDGEVSRMGMYDLDKRARGSYYLDTNQQPLYAKG